MSIRASNIFESKVLNGLRVVCNDNLPADSLFIVAPDNMGLTKNGAESVVMATIPALAEDTDPGLGNSAGTERPMAVSRDEPRQYVNRGRIVTLYAGHPSLPPGYDPMRETHDGRMPLDEGDE